MHVLILVFFFLSELFFLCRLILSMESSQDGYLRVHFLRYRNLWPSVHIISLFFFFFLVNWFWFEIQEISMHVISEFRFDLIAMTVMGHCDILPFVEMCCCRFVFEAITFVFVCFSVRIFRRHSFTRTKLSQQFDQPRQKTHSSSDIVSTKRSYLMTLTIIKNHQNERNEKNREEEKRKKKTTKRRKR